jgi:poly-gamma-glutamate synthesis protein (capsule biosynthesis protein)
VKLLSFDGSYYLDSFMSGAVFRSAEFTGEEASAMNGVRLNQLDNKDNVLKINMSGVTALTRVMMNKLAEVGDPLYFSEFIGDFLGDADLTHVSNEVSFKDGCTVNYAIFCSPPEMIEVLKDSGVDLVELTGNHNNDVGSEYNTETINLYRSLGWNVVGGGLNTEDAAKSYILDQKGSKLAFLAYNYPDSPNGNAIAGTSTAGANSFDFDRITTEIEAAKQQASSVVVNVQFWECYAYPDGYVEFPECYSPIPNQKEVFRQLIDLGADIVVGSSAHQPQTYEMYNGKPIYYGLGNLYFDQTQWPGTEKGIILTNYYVAGELLQTKLSPTVFDTALQTRLMTEKEAEDLLQKLNTARSVSGL